MAFSSYDPDEKTEPQSGGRDPDTSGSIDDRDVDTDSGESYQDSYGTVYV